MAEVKSGQRDAGPRFKLHEREKWLHDFELLLLQRTEESELLQERL